MPSNNTLERIPERVDAGIKWLDGHEPGWRDKINLETLLLSSPCNCIWGQLLFDPTEVTTGYWRRPKFFQNKYNAVAFGFTCWPGDDVSEYMDALDREWKRRLSE